MVLGPHPHGHRVAKRFFSNALWPLLPECGLCRLVDCFALRPHRNFVFALPPREEQKIIIEKVELLMNKCLKLSQEIETLDKHGKTLMKAMFNETFETKAEIIHE